MKPQQTCEALTQPFLIIGNSVTTKWKLQNTYNKSQQR